MDVLLGALPVALLLFAAATAQGFLGFGFGMIAMAVLGFSGDLIHAAGTVNLTGLVLAIYMTLQMRGHVLWSLLRWMLPALAVGVLLGVGALQSFDRDLMVAVLGISVTAIALWNLISPKLQQSDSVILDAAAGFVGGLLGGAFNTGGPPIVAHLYRRREDPEALKATVQVFFVAIGALRLPAAIQQGQVDASVWREAALGVPLVLLGAWCGMRMARRIEPERFRALCWWGLAALGIGLLIKG